MIQHSALIFISQRWIFKCLPTHFGFWFSVLVFTNSYCLPNELKLCEDAGRAPSTCSSRAMIEFNGLFEVHSMSNQWTHIQHLLIHVISAPSGKKKIYIDWMRVQSLNLLRWLNSNEMEMTWEKQSNTVNPKSGDGMECSNQHWIWKKNT